MNHIQSKDRQARLSIAEERAEHLRVVETRLQDELVQIKFLLDEVSQPKIAEFLKRWSERETIRLAKVGMSFPVDDRDNRLILEGQYNQTIILGNSVADFQERVDEIQREIHANSVELADLNRQIKKMKG